LISRMKGPGPAGQRKDSQAAESVGNPWALYDAVVVWGSKWQGIAPWDVI